MIINASDYASPSLLLLGRKLQKGKWGNAGTRQPRKYIDIITAFDIETCACPELPGNAMMYVWQWCFYYPDKPDDYIVIMGRTWDELRLFIQQLLPAIRAYDDRASMVVLVHNLAYEFQFLRTIYDFGPDEVFCLDSRKPAKATMYRKELELRCTYIHSNMSLAQYTKKMGVKHVKLSGEDYDYKKTRYPWTPLTEEERAYCAHDVIGLCEAYHAEMQLDGDNLATMPLTSTGYVRRICKRAMKHSSKWEIKNSQPDENLYPLLRDVFRGGDTHCNRYYSGFILEDVKSADRSSSYPDVMCNCQFPRGAFRQEQHPSEKKLEYLLSNNRAVLMRVAFTGLRQRDKYWGFPYVPYSKCQKAVRPLLDNGRILKADYLEIALCDIDLYIIRETYEWDRFEVQDLWSTYYGHLPTPLIMVTQEFYRDKTELKGVPGQEVYYTKRKNLLNSLYGMMAQNPVRQSIQFISSDPRQYVEADKPLEELLEENERRAFLTYQHGVYVTAWARLRLYEGQKLAGDNGVYCDTDSVKYINDIDWEPYNAQRIADSKASGSYATDPAGITHYMGVYEQEHTMARFRSWGAKKYAYQFEPGGKTYVTISGVNKGYGGPELDEHGGLEAFKPGFVFHRAGGTESVYNDHTKEYIQYADGHELELGPNILIRDSTYEVSVATDYDRLLKSRDMHIKLCKHLGLDPDEII